MPQPKKAITESAEERQVSRVWLLAACAGFTGIICVLIIATLVVVDKARCGALVGSNFLQMIIGGLLMSAIIMLLGAFRCAKSRDWRKIALIAWALTAVGSPVFGWMIILPWAAMAISSPVVAVALYGLWQRVR